MDAIKNALHIGKHKDEGITAGTGTDAAPQSDVGRGSFNAGVPTGTSDAPELYTLPSEEKKEHGILRQILNPGGEKYSDLSYGQTATTDSKVPGVVDHNEASQNQPKEHGILKQIFNPGNDKYDPQNFQGSDDVLAAGSTSGGQPIPGALGTGSEARPVESTEAAQDNHGVLRQLVNPGGEKYDEMRFAPTGNVATGSSTTAPSTAAHTAPTHESHVGRDAALGAGAGAVAYEASKSHRGDELSDSRTTTTLPERSTAPQQTTSSIPATYGTSSGSQQTAGGSYQTTGAPASTTQTPGNAGYTSQSASDSHRGAEAATLGAAGLGAAGLAAHEHNKHNTASETTPQSYGTGSAYPSAQSTGAPSLTAGTVYDRSQPAAQNSRSTEGAALGTGIAAGGLAGSQTGQQEPVTSGLSHHVHNGMTEPLPASSTHHDHSAPRLISVTEGTGPAGKPVHHPHGPSYDVPSAYEDGHSAKVYNTVTGRHSVEDSEVPHHESSTTKDTAAAAGAGALGGAALASAGAHDTSRSTGPTGSGNTVGGITSSSAQPGYQSTASQVPSAQTTSATQPSSQTTGTSAGYGHQSTYTSGTAPAALAAQEAMRRHDVQQSSTTGTSAQGQPEHHYGRDAALAGGAGAVGVGAYEAGKHADSGPASKTIGPHDSNIANVLDPRVQPQPELQKTSTTTGPHKSDLLNKLDPRVKNESTKTDESSHTGRDAALGAGAGAATGGAIYEAEKHHGHKEPTTSSQPTSTQTTTTTSTTTTTDPHKSSLLNKLDPRVKNDQSDKETERSHTGRDAALGAGAGAATGAGVYEAEKHHGHKQPTTSTQPTSTTDTTSTTGPHKSGLLNKLDPRVKNEQTERDSDRSHTGRDAALAGGAGAATGAGIYEAEKPHISGTSHTGYGNQQTSGQYAGYGQSDTTPHKSGLLNKLDPRTSSEPTEQQSSSHTGRDAALAGGAGAATGAGIYEAEKHHHGASTGTSSQPQGYGQSSTVAPQQSYGQTQGYGQTYASAPQQGYGQTQASAQPYGTAQSSGPASKTVGPHESNVANVLDPRVQPQPQHMKEHTTTGPYQSDTLNKLDPRVQSDPAKSQTQTSSHEGRDLAAGAGVGAATGAAIESHEDKKQSRPLVREDEHHHNKLHKEPKEKKEGFLHKLLHPHKKDKEGELDSPTGSEQRYQETGASTGATGAGVQGSGVTGQQSSLPTDPHTGLPINVEKYGQGVGGTDGSENITGYQTGGQTHAADWQDISKKNTPY